MAKPPVDIDGTIVFRFVRAHRGLLPIREKVCLTKFHDLQEQVPSRQAVFLVNLSDMPHGPS